MEKTKELVFIPGPGLGHLVSAVETGQKILSRHHHLFITYLLMDMIPNDKPLYNYTQSLSSATTPPPRLRFTNVSRTQPDYTQELNPKNPSALLVEYICSQKPLVREAVLEIIKFESSQVVGFIVDLFCVSMIDVADEFKIPSYVFFTSSAGFLSIMLQVQTISDELKQDITEYKDTDKELLIPGFQNQVPAKVLPSGMLDKHGTFDLDMSIARGIRRSKGIIVNTFMELETDPMKALLSDGKNPPVYTIGPVINLKHHSDEDEKIRRWLDNQPVSSVVFLCFGSWGWLKGEQVKEVAAALERSGYRFLWSLRRPPMDGTVGSLNDYENPGEVLPSGFLERTCGVGKVTGWTPQVAVLSHPAIGGFVSHCGWNSILESVWFGVPIAGWPIYAEQHMNAFEMVVELGLAVDINMDRKIIVSSEEIERGIRQLMNGNEIRKKVKEMKEKSHKTLIEGGSSYDFLGRLIDVIVQDSIFSNT
ncbi:unnamed protein product [Fraxinus pennsylvanica]|uniref:Glycosyltransferase n=1 Tax=Fraxinus pennsylvanica TaxID=56036 RepID=A0AAD1ZDX6_9LAMI|nr:unnamed protein product [Fraxinus pennsylvanica]